VLRQAIAYAIAGVAVGLALALVAGRWIEPLLYKQSPRDPVVFALVFALMLAAAVIAAAAPGARAIRADPNRVLRAE
jgi:ABC-type antimicrobial peptide transport system permease subunit